MKIRRKQFEAFQPVADESFVRRLGEYLRQKHADVAVQRPEGAYTVNQVPDETLRLMVRAGIARARGYGMSWESTLAAFIVLMFVTSPNFDEHPLIRRVLRDENIPPDRRIDQLWERVSDQSWDVAKQNYDPSAWNLEPKDAEG